MAVSPAPDAIAPIHVAELTVEDTYRAVASAPAGLSDAEAHARLQQFGPNRLAEVKGAPIYRKLLANFTHLMAILLWVGGSGAPVSGLQLAAASHVVTVGASGAGRDFAGRADDYAYPRSACWRRSCVGARW